MCNLFEAIAEEKYTGWKAVLVHTESGRMYSPATGVEYAAGKPVTPFSGVTRLRDSTFANDLATEDHAAYSENMVGRTCVFMSLDDALQTKRSLACHSILDGEVDVSDDYDLAVVSMTVSGELMRGEYGDEPVVGGKFIEEIGEAQYVEAPGESELSI